MKQALINNLKNLRGWRTDRKIVVFSVDDYGNVRVDSKAARSAMDRCGLKIYNRFDAFDSLETREDLELLFSILQSNPSPSGSVPKFTAFAVPNNIDFELMKDANFRAPILERLDITFKKLAALQPESYDGAWHTWQEGIENEVIRPEYHGSQHFNMKVFQEKLENRDSDVICALENRSYTSIDNSGYPTVSPMAACEFWERSENTQIEAELLQGLTDFRQVFGFEATHFNPPGGRESFDIHEPLKNAGIRHIDLPLFGK